MMGMLAFICAVNYVTRLQYLPVYFIGLILSYRDTVHEIGCRPRRTRPLPFFLFCGINLGRQRIVPD